MANRLSESRTNALSSLDDRRVRAAEGAQFAAGAAHDKLVDDLTKILQRKQDLAGERGAFKAATMGQLEEAARKRATDIKIASGHDTAAANRADATITQQERNSKRSAGIDPDTGKPIPGGKLDPKAQKKGKRVTASGAPAVSADAHLAFQNKVQEIASYVDRYKGKVSRKEIVAKLQKGRPQQTVYADPKTGNPVAKNTPGAVAVPLTKIPQYQPDLAMSAALDVALDGHLSRPTQQKLQQHYILSELGLPTYQEWRKRGGSPQGQQVAHAVQSVQQVLAQALGG
jgi:hypothetical protein